MGRHKQPSAYLDNPERHRLSVALHFAIQDRDEDSIRAIGRKAVIPQPVLHRFIHEQGTLTSQQCDRLIEVLSLDVIDPERGHNPGWEPAVAAEQEPQPLQPMTFVPDPEAGNYVEVKPGEV